MFRIIRGGDWCMCTHTHKPQRLGGDFHVPVASLAQEACSGEERWGWEPLLEGGIPSPAESPAKALQSRPDSPFSASLSNRAGLQLWSKFVTRFEREVRKRKCHSWPQGSWIPALQGKKIWKWIFRYVSEMLVYAQTTEGQAPDLSDNNINSLVEANPDGTCGNRL